jgi:pyroglutamyl-peptidase
MHMSITLLITGFGTFPGAPFNPTELLAQVLGERRHPSFANVRRLSHVFTVSYEAIDRELPALLERERPDVLLMFGVALRSTQLRIETRARNLVARALPDVNGYLPFSGTIVAGGPAALPVRAPTQRLLVAAQSTGLPAALSRDAGRYLCNYLCWRATEAAWRGATRLAAFIHVPYVPRAPANQRSRVHFSVGDLAEVGEAIARTAVMAARSSR